MKITTLFNTEESLAQQGATLKLFFSYASGTGATSAMVDEARELEAAGNKVIISLIRSPKTGEPEGDPFDLQSILNANPDLVVIDDIGYDNDDSARNKHRYQDVDELLRAGISVYATMVVGNLEGEADRYEQITGTEATFTVPDRVFYRCGQLEFVDIDPQELLARHKAAGIAKYNYTMLKELRAVALHCVSEYASYSSESDKDHRLGRSVEEKVLALIALDGTADTVVHEGARMAEALDADFYCLFVETAAKDSVYAARDNEVLSKLEELVESLGGTLVTLNGEDALGVTTDYVQAHGITDIVLARKPITAFRRFVLPLALPYDDKLAAHVPNVHIHTVPTVKATKKFKVYNPRLKKTAFELSIKDLLFTIMMVAIATFVIYLISNIGFSNQTSVLVYILATAIVARYTKGYVAGFLASLLAALAMSYFFVRPYFSFAVDHKANYVTFVVMIVVSLIITTLSTKMQRQSERARYREQHTQVLYDLNRSMLFTRGVFDVINTSLDTLTRLFDRAVIFYTGDPFAKGTARTRPASSDANITVFDSPVEREAASWVFANNANAGATTDTLSIAEALYLPLTAGDEVRGVLGISMRTGVISQDEATFLDMVTGQIALALERQHLFDEHRFDLSMAELDSVRARFAVSVAGYADSSAAIISTASRQLLTCKATETERFKRITKILASESHREKRFTEALSVMLTNSEAEEQLGKSANITDMVREAVDIVREKRPRSFIDFEMRTVEVDMVVENTLVILAVASLLEYATVQAPQDSIVQVSIKTHKHAIDISIADDRANFGVTLNKALSSRFMAEREKSYIELLEMPPAQVEEQLQTDERPKILELIANDESEINLAIASAAVRAHGGRVSIRKRLGGGAVTSIWLPR